MHGRRGKETGKRGDKRTGRDEIEEKGKRLKCDCVSECESERTRQGEDFYL